MTTEHEPHFYFSMPDLEVLGFSGMEGISELFHFQVELVSKSRDISFDKLVGKPATVTIVAPSQLKRYVSGVVSRFELVRIMPNKAVYHAHLSPPQIRLTLRRKLRIFQDMTTKDIVSQVLTEGGVTSFEWKGCAYEPRNYCVQYRETDMDFIARLLEEDGIAYHFEHSPGDCKTVFTDTNAAFQPIIGNPKVIYNPITSMVADQEYVSDFSFGQQLRSGKVQLRDYEFKVPGKPGGTIVEQSATGKESALELYDAPGEHVGPPGVGFDNPLAKRLVNIRLQEAETEYQLGYGGSDCSRMTAGYRFTLGGGNDSERHPRKDLNQEYLLTRVSHNGSQPAVLEQEGSHEHATYGCSLVVIPFKVPFRPPRVTPRPIAHGNHTATVVGPAGEEIYVDKFSRVKVAFHWDRLAPYDETSSCWIRVSQHWAGLSYGAMFIPRIGQEVLVSFIEGDPDRPIVTGRVYNAKQLVPYELPKNKTMSTIKSATSPGGKGFNELRYEDKAGKEEIFIHAQKDYNIVVENDRTSLIKHDRKEEVKNDQEVHVTKKSTHTATEIYVEAKSKITLKVGGSTIVITPASIEVSSTMITSKASAIHTIKGGLVKIN
jgi:type VI secretion system secreted protein VgrG